MYFLFSLQSTLAICLIMLQQLSLCIQNIIEAMIWGALSKLDALVNQQLKTGSQGLLLHSSLFFYTKTRFNPDKRAKCTSVPGPHTTSTIMSGLQAMVPAQACLSLLRREIFFPPFLNLIIFPRKRHAVKTTHHSLHLLKTAFKADSFNWLEVGNFKTHTSAIVQKAQFLFHPARQKVNSESQTLKN